MGADELERNRNQVNNSHVNAGGNLTIQTGGDANIIGAVVNSDTADIDVGGDLTVASVQDTGEVDGKRWDVSVSVSTGGGSANVGAGNTTGSTAWVNEQTGINTNGEMNIHVGGHTQVDGAYINSDSGDLTLDTGTFGFTDIEDHDKESSTYVNIGTGFSNPGDNNASQHQNNVGTGHGSDPNSSNTYGSISANHSSFDREQINRATIGEGTITIRDNPDQDLSDLNRDIDDAQEVTKDESESVDVYASTGALDALSDPEATAKEWGDLIARYGKDTVNNLILVKRNIQAMGNQAPPSVRAVFPLIEQRIDRLTLLGADVDGLIEVVNNEEFQDTVEKLGTIARLAEINPQALKEQIAGEITVDTVDENGMERMTIFGKEGGPLSTQILDGLNSLGKMVNSVTEGHEDLIDIVETVMGGATSLLLGVVVEKLAETEAGRKVLAEVEKEKKKLIDHIAAHGAGSDSTDEYRSNLDEEKVVQDSDFNRSMQGGGAMALEIAALAAVLLGAKALKTDNSSGGNSDSGGNNSGSGSDNNNEYTPAGDNSGMGGANLPLNLDELNLPERVGFKGLSQNRKLQELTHHDITKAFDGTGYTVSGHAIHRLKHPRTKRIRVQIALMILLGFSIKVINLMLEEERLDLVIEG